MKFAKYVVKTRVCEPKAKVCEVCGKDPCECENENGSNKPSNVCDKCEGSCTCDGDPCECENGPNKPSDACDECEDSCTCDDPCECENDADKPKGVCDKCEGSCTCDGDPCECDNGTDKHPVTDKVIVRFELPDGYEALQVYKMDEVKSMDSFHLPDTLIGKNADGSLSVSVEEIKVSVK